MTRKLGLKFKNAGTPLEASGAEQLLNLWRGTDGGLAVDFTDISTGASGSTVYGSMQIVDAATPANNFVTTSSLTPFDKIYYTGASLRMCYGSDGVLRYAPHNLLFKSENFSLSPWSLDNGSALDPVVTTNAGTAPDGTTTADRIVFDKTGGSYSRIRQSFTAPAGSTGRFSVYMKTYSGGTANVGLRVYDQGINVVVTGSWQLFTHEGPEAGGGMDCQIMLFDSIAGNDETADILVWGATGQILPVHTSNYMTDNLFTDGSLVYSPRIDYAPTWPYQVRGLLMEEARTNLVLYSGSSGTGWTKFNVTVSDTVSAPDGTTNATRVTEAGGGSVVQEVENAATITITGSATYTISRFFKDGDRRYVFLSCSGTTSNRWFAVVADLQTGTITKTGAGAGGTYTSSSIQDIGGGWYRVTATGVCGADTSAYHIYGPSNSGTPSFGAYGIPTIYLGTAKYFDTFGGQLEAGAFATSYIPTTSAGVTRAVDSLEILASDFNYDSTAVTRYVEAYTSTISQDFAQPGSFFSVGNTSARMYLDNGVGSQWNGSANVQTANSASNNATFKLAVSGTASSRSICLNGGTVATSATSPLFLSGNNIYFGSAASNYTGQAWLQKIMHLPVTISDTNLQVITA